MRFFVPGKRSPAQALRRATHLGIGAHQDDLEIMAYDGILRGYSGRGNSFFGVVATDGSGSARSASDARRSPEAFSRLRDREQERAARIGRYGGVAFLGYPSSALKSPRNKAPVRDLAALLSAARPRVVYTHNPADRHATHVAVALRAIEALRSLAPRLRPEKFYGCEVWRDLDWLSESDRVFLNVSGRDALALRLLRAFRSQNLSGKRYDLAALGRRKAHATFSDSHRKDRAQSAIFAMDLSPLLENPRLKVHDFVSSKILKFREDAVRLLRGLS